MSPTRTMEAGASGLPFGSASTGARLDSSDPQPSSTAAPNQDSRAATPLNEAICEPRPLDNQPFHAPLSQYGQQSQPTTPSGANGIASTATTRAAFSFGGAAVDPRHSPVHNIPSGSMSGCDMPATPDPDSDDNPLTQGTWGTEFMLSPPTPVASSSTSVPSLRDSLAPDGSPMKRRGSGSSSSSPPSIEVTTEPTTPFPSAESRPSSIHRRVAKQLHPKPVSDEESAPSQSSASVSGAEGWSCGEGSSATETASSALSASDSAARASASVSAGSDSSDPFPKPTPRSVTHRRVPLPFTSDSSSDNHGPPTRTRIPYSSRRPIFTSLPRDSSGQARYTALPPPTQVSTAVQTESVVHVHVHHHHPPHPHSHSHYQISSHPTKSRTPDGHSSDQGNWSETKDQLSSLPQKSWIGRTSSEYFQRDSISDRWEEASAYSTLSARTVRSNYSAQSAHSTHSAHSAHSAHSNHSVRSEPLMAPRPAVETVQLYRSMSVSGGLRRRRTTRPSRAYEVEAAYGNLVDLMAYPVSPLGELMGVARSDTVGMYPAGMAPAWARVAPRVRNTGGLAPHGSFTSRRGSRSLVPAPPSTNVFSDAASTSTRSPRSGSSKGGSGGSRSTTKPASLEVSSSNTAKLFTPPSKAVKLDASSSPAAKVDTSSSTRSKLKSSRVPPSVASNDTTAAIGQLGNANLTRFQLNDLETAAKLGDQLAAYHLGWDDPSRRQLARSASLSLGLHRRTLSSTSLKVARRPVPSRRTSIETENPSNKLDFAALSASSSSLQALRNMVCVGR